MSDSITELQRDALCLTQALLGVISQNFRMVSVTRQRTSITIRILLAIQCDEDIEEIEDLKTEFEALSPRSVDFNVEIVFSQEPIILEPPSVSTIVVFRRRES
ncbi:MAG: hypothetical protein ACE37I_12085 [Rubinisphaera brasiliensis]|uniref:hypothetical protein n=1 Tax=Rubinisphaera TaxID=1649490 RepID=UPI001F3A5AED|nr:hypothetical protein [Rubinisphaera sp. JC750]